MNVQIILPGGSLDPGGPTLSLALYIPTLIWEVMMALGILGYQYQLGLCIRQPWKYLSIPLSPMHDYSRKYL